VSDKNKALTRAVFDEADRTERLDPALIAPDFTAHIAGNPPMNVDAFQQFLTMFYEGFSDFSHTFEDMVAEGDRVVFRVLAQATHTGEFMGIPATGTRVSVSQIGMSRIAGGKVAELWNSPDRLGLMQQLGVVPAQ
jgi:predicted ester cyclase